jgi:hypothetical protein
MLVRDEDGVDGVEIVADRGHALAQLPHAQPGIDQNSRVPGRQQRGVTRRPACQHAKPYDGLPPWTFQNTRKQSRWGMFASRMITDSHGSPLDFEFLFIGGYSPSSQL